MTFVNADFVWCEPAWNYAIADDIVYWPPVTSPLIVTWYSRSRLQPARSSQR